LLGASTSPSVDSRLRLQVTSGVLSGCSSLTDLSLVVAFAAEDKHKRGH